ncbi:MAG: methyltransferase domain-containing protein [Betaproteobacteria bacterium]|nr:methyltransferase domain-containing protein [Betaproteobacteria bacterium]
MDTLASYDELPYDSLPLPETQPDFLAAVATLHGFDAPDPTQARILELGCASGGNLIPLAWRWPGSECVGVELSRVQAEAGDDFIRHLGLPNIRIVHGDLAALPADLGEFDYIIAHGVFSWVPPAIQRALLDVCRRHLASHGVAYVSFNVTAGWAPLLPLRTALLERTAVDLPAPARFAEARRVLAELEAEWTDPVLLKEIAYLKSAAPSYLFHEYLTEFNMPTRFADFAAQLDDHGLRYVGEVGPRHAVVELEDAWGLIPESMAGRWLDAEAALDEAHAIRFRRALIARADTPCARPPQAEALTRLTFHADLRSDDEIDLDTANEQAFINPAGCAFPVAQPAMKAAAMILSAAYPAALAYPELLASTKHALADYDAAGDVDEAVFRNALFQLVMAHGVMPSVDTMPYVTEPADRPGVHFLARLQATSPGWTVSGARHVALELDEPGRILLGLLDGSRTLDELAVILRNVLTDAGYERTLETVQAMTHRLVWLFARQGLLMEAPGSSAGLQ